MDSVSDPEFRHLSLDEFLGRVSVPEPAPAGGSAAALTAALAASLCVKAARLSARTMNDSAELATAAGGLRDRAASLCDDDAIVYGEVVEAQRTGDARALADALSSAANVPLEVAVVATETAEIAARLAAGGNENLVGDAVTAALLAVAAAQSAATLVALNLASWPQDERHRRARQLVASAEASGARARQALAP